MPNWCSTTYAFYNASISDDEDFTRFKNEMSAFLKESLNTKSDTDRWLGTLAKHFGFDTETFPYGLRGWITYYENCGDHFKIWVEDAWCYHNGVFELILEKYFPDVAYVLCAEEPGCEVYVNTDIDHDYLVDKYCVSIINKEEDYVEDMTYCASDDELEQLKNDWLEENPNYDFEVYEFENDSGIY